MLDRSTTPSIPPPHELDPSHPLLAESFSRWLDSQPVEILARCLERQIDRIGHHQRQLGRSQSYRKQVASRIVERLKAESAEGREVDGIFYRPHADGRGLERIKLRDPKGAEPRG